MSWHAPWDIARYVGTDSRLTICLRQPLLRHSRIEQSERIEFGFKIASLFAGKLD